MHPNSINWIMDNRYSLYLFFVVWSCCVGTSFGNNLNCPAPRAPDNGLSFIFRNGQMVHFRCHPGYEMRGKPVSYCINNQWTEASPFCIPINKRSFQEQARRNWNSNSVSEPRELFNWENGERRSVYGDGPRRLPLINGIWPSQDHREQVLALGPQSTPGPRTMIKEEIDIAELRNQQLEELRKQRYRGKKRQGHKKGKNRRKYPAHGETNVPRETVVSLASTENDPILSVAYAKSANVSRNHGPYKNRHRSKKLKSTSYPTSSSFIISRASRVDTSGIAPYHTKYQFGSPGRNEVYELRRRPTEEVHSRGNGTMMNYQQYDTSCVELLYGREVPMIAPQVRNAFVFRYETKKNPLYPFNSYMAVKYRCFSGYAFANARAQALYCKEASWVGEMPRCLAGSALD